jgi:hypothetical protein
MKYYNSLKSNERRVQMQNLKDRFECCDPRSFTYLEKVLERLPPDVKKDILDAITKI